MHVISLMMHKQLSCPRHLMLPGVKMRKSAAEVEMLCARRSILQFSLCSCCTCAAVPPMVSSSDERIDVHSGKEEPAQRQAWSARRLQVTFLSLMRVCPFRQKRNVLCLINFSCPHLARRLCSAAERQRSSTACMHTRSTIGHQWLTPIVLAALVHRRDSMRHSCGCSPAGVHVT
jgi:hypothetical protein